MRKKDLEKKVRFIEILLTVGSLLGTALTLSNLVQVWEISIVSLCLFLLFSIAYYDYINYVPLKNDKEISRFKSISLMIAIFFSVIFSNVLSKPIINNFTNLQNLIPGSPITKTIVLSILIIITIFSYFFIITKVIYQILTKGIDGN